MVVDTYNPSTQEASMILDLKTEQKTKQTNNSNNKTKKQKGLEAWLKC
jgi:hypothetical protein